MHINKFPYRTFVSVYTPISNPDLFKISSNNEGNLTLLWLITSKAEFFSMLLGPLFFFLCYPAVHELCSFFHWLVIFQSFAIILLFFIFIVNIFPVHYLLFIYILTYISIMYKKCGQSTKYLLLWFFPLLLCLKKSLAILRGFFLDPNENYVSKRYNDFPPRGQFF